jgi:uncharacterized SAM-dependent methyltransferase
MHLVSKYPQTVRMDSQDFSFEEGEHITTEYSYKYTLKGFERLASKAGFEPVKHWEDPGQLFSVLFFHVRKPMALFEEDFRRIGMKRLTKIAVS